MDVTDELPQSSVFGCRITESRPGEVLAQLHESAHAEREYLFAARAASADDLILVAWLGEEAVGYIAATDQRSDGLLIWEHLVVPSHRGQGLGERLLLEAVRRTLPGAIVEVDPMAELELERVIDYYHRLGFSRSAANGGVWATASDVIRSAARRHKTSIEEQSPVSAVLRLKNPGVITLRPADLVRDLIATLNEHHIGAVVVSSDGSRIEGIVSERDVLLALDRDGAEVLSRPVQTLVVTDVVTCTAHDQLSSVMATMTRERIRHMPVTSTGRLVGMLSIGDLVNFRLYEIEAAGDWLRREGAESPASAAS